MIKTIAIIGFLSLCAAFNSYAHDTDRIDQLKKEVQTLQHRVSKLESLLSSPDATQEVETTSEGWKSIANWRKLATGMPPDDVEKILGEPQRVQGGTLAIWYYQNHGRVEFLNAKLVSWSEPL
ncbi:MAG: hypothetical protein ABW140_10690 [Candidatus Sedimenticola sp. 6PFRAG1]